MNVSLLTTEQLAVVPKLYETEDIEMNDKRIVARLYCPSARWDWYVIECDGTDQCFGLVKGHETEFGYFSLNELSQLNAGYGDIVLNDPYFASRTVKEVLNDLI